MNKISRLQLALAIAVTGGCLLATVSHTFAQQVGTLYRNNGPLTLSRMAWIYQDVPPPRRYQKEDIITILVNERAQTLSEGEVQRRRQARMNAVLSDWVSLRGLDLKPAQQPNGDLAVNASLNGQYRAENEMETFESIRFTIASKVKTVLPNGNLVVEAVRTIRHNNELWEQSLIGEIRPEDVLPNNKVLSENIADLRIEKNEAGHVRDSYKRGWLFRIYDKMKPF